jgi:hypothetical protein
MKKASKPGSAKTSSAQKTAAKLANLKEPQGGAALAETVAQLSRATEKLARAADKLAEAAVRLSAAAEARHQSVETPSRSATDAIPRQQSEASGPAAQPE